MGYKFLNDLWMIWKLNPLNGKQYVEGRDIDSSLSGKKTFYRFISFLIRQGYCLYQAAVNNFLAYANCPLW